MQQDHDELIAARQKTHGKFKDVSVVSQELKYVCQASPGWERLTAVQKEALDLILHKVARILSGDPNFRDHWDDVIGYVKRVLEAIEEQTKKVDE